ncbi:hypothetical protein CSA08_03275 [Candidatus Gracilibacteria bacterium]|nr:MAG: hypothetical protein CSA08_03275 [Candidatus Gracilibacteria bacterium]
MAEKEQLNNPDLSERIDKAKEIVLNAIEDAFYEVASDTEKELYEKVKELSKINDRFFDESINILIKQIKNSPSGKQRDLLENQINELKKINKLYKEFKKVKMTRKTNTELSSLFNEVLTEIRDFREIENEREEIEEKFEKEKEKLKDKVIDGSYRDLVEKSIDIKVLYLESINETKQIEDFYNLFTIEYINLLDKKGKGKDFPDESNFNDGLNLSEPDLIYIVNIVIKKLDLINKQPDFNEIEFRINGGTKIISIDEIINKEKEENNKEKLKTEIIKDYFSLIDLFKKNDFKGLYSGINNSLSKDGKDSIELFRKKTISFSREEVFTLLKDAYKKDSGNKENLFLLVPFLEIYGLGKETLKTLDYGLENYILGGIVTLPDEKRKYKKIKFTKEFIEKNKNTMLENLKVFFSYLMVIETSGGRLDMESSAGAKGVVQFMDGYKNGKKIKNGQWSFKTALNRAKNFWGKDKPNYISEAEKWGGRIKVDEFGPDKQLSIWISDAIMREKTKPELLMGILLGNVWSAKEYYKKKHNTEKGKEVSDVVKKRTRFFSKRFIQIK